MTAKMRDIAGRAVRTVFLASPARAAVGSFLVVILMGAVLLALPISSAQRRWTPFVDAIFTSTSAVCVTGLIVKDTPLYWSTFGQVVILCLIQAGGLGIMTLSAFLAIMLRRRLSMGFESVMSDLVEVESQENVWDLVRFICIFTFLAELVGTALLYYAWRGDFQSFWRRLYVSVFHAVSAFCNAGFSLFSDSLVRYRGCVGVNLIVCGLILTGGIGFLVVRELKHYAAWKLFVRRGKSPKLSTHSKLVLTVTGVLLALGFFGVLGIEWTGSFGSMPLKERLLAAMFQSVTPRTAGFNTVDLSTLATSTAFLLIGLMFIGGSPGSTAGGIKTSTVGVMIASIIATLKGRSRAEMFHHSVRPETVHRVASIILLSVTALVCGVFLLLITEKGAGFFEVLFEATSAFGTVGLSLGVTPRLTVPGRIIITALMFIGRLGPITLLMSAAQVEDRVPYSYPDAHIMVG